MILRVIVPEDLEIILVGIYSRTDFVFCGVVEVGTADVVLGIGTVEPDVIRVEKKGLRSWQDVPWAWLAGYSPIF